MTEHITAAVVVPFVGDELLFGVRSAASSTHATQVGFPGGTPEPVDGGLRETALREFDEEVTASRASLTVVDELVPTRPGRAGSVSSRSWRGFHRPPTRPPPTGNS